MPVARLLRLFVPLALLLLVAGPLLWAVGSTVPFGMQAPAWAALLQHPQTWPALGMTIWTGLSATLLATGITACILARWLAATGTAQGLDKWARWMSPLLSVPHAAFAIGMVALLAPGGWLLRLISPWPSGLESPPAWATT
ncbi:MAG: hypothetical protein RJB68_804, partial [Pseudomonadota bacterium]